MPWKRNGCGHNNHTCRKRCFGEIHVAFHCGHRKENIVFIRSVAWLHYGKILWHIHPIISAIRSGNAIESMRHEISAWSKFRGPLWTLNRRGELHRWVAGDPEPLPRAEGALPAVPRAPSGAGGLPGHGWHCWLAQVGLQMDVKRDFNYRNGQTDIFFSSTCHFRWFMSLLRVKNVLASANPPQNGTRLHQLAETWRPTRPVPCLGLPEWSRRYQRVGGRRCIFPGEWQSFSAKKCGDAVATHPICFNTNVDSFLDT